MRDWTTRRWTGALLGTVGAGLLLGLPTDLVPNPIFGRQIEAPGWAYPAWIVTSILMGLIIATYVRNEARNDGGAEGQVDVGDDTRTGGGRTMSPDERKATAGGLLAVFAVGCPTCNALVVMALGANGALAFFEPVQPFLAVGAIALLALALKRRIASEKACDIPVKA